MKLSALAARSRAAFQRRQTLWLRAKTRDAAIEYTRYIGENHPDLTHTSLSDAMETLGLSWEGVAHTSIADTIGCAKVWEALFPNYYDEEKETER